MLKFLRPLLALVVATCAAPVHADTTLSPTSIVQPVVGASSNTWGTTINANSTTINGWFDTGPALKVANGGTGSTTAAGARTNLAVPGLATTNTYPSVQTFTVAPVFTDASGTRTALGLPIGTSGADRPQDMVAFLRQNAPLLNGANTWAAAQTFSAATNFPNSANITTAGRFVSPTATGGASLGLLNNLNPASGILSVESTANGVRAAEFFASNAAANQIAILIRNDTTTSSPLYFTYGAATAVGSVTHNATTTSYNTTSDARLKTDITALSGALARLARLRPVRFHFKSDMASPKVDGFLAHEVSAVVPEAVTGKKDAMNPDGSIRAQQMDASKLVPLLVAAVQELTARVAVLEAANDNVAQVLSRAGRR